MYFNLSKKYPFDLAKLIFGPKGISHILNGLKEIKSSIADVQPTKTQPLGLMAPGLPSPKDSIGDTPQTPPHNPTSGYARLGVGPEPIDFDKVYGSKFSRMWKNHVSRLRDSANRVKQDFTTIWQHHNERVAQSVQYAGGQFNKLKTSASNAFGAMSKMVGNAANNIRNAFSKIFAYRSRTKVATTPTSVIPYIDGEQKQANRFSQIWQNHITRLRDSIGRVKQDFSTIWQHHNERVAGSVKYAGMQFNKLRTSASNVFSGVSKSVSNTVNNIRTKFGQVADIMKSKIPATRSKAAKTTASGAASAYTSRYRTSSANTTSTTGRVSAEASRIWKVHIANLKRDYQSIQGAFSTVWGHHQERMSASIKNTSAQFDAFKKKITNIQIPQWAKNAANSFKNFFGNAISHVQSAFGKFGKFVGNIFNKIKTTASDGAKAFKDRLGYNNQPNDSKISTPASWMDVSLSKTQLSVSDGDAAKIDLINAKLHEGQQSFNDYMSGANNASDALKAYYASLNGAQGSISGFNTFLKNNNAGLKASGVAARLAAVGHTILNAALSMGLSILISGVISAISSLINKHKELAEAAENAIDVYNTATQTLKDHHDTIEDIKKDYAELADGVDNLGRNVSLSSDEFERYNEITNKIADMFPNMVSGYTEEGNAIIALKGNVDALTKAYEAEAQAARDAILVESNDIFENFKNNTSKKKFNWYQLGKVSQTEKISFFKAISSGVSISDWKKNNSGSIDDSLIDTWLEDAGISSTNWFSDDKDFDYAIRKYLDSVQAYYRMLQSEFTAEVSPIKSIINAYLGNNKDYKKLSDEGKNIAQAIISGFDTEFYARDEFEDWTDVAAWIDANVVQQLQDTGNLKEFNIAFDLQTQFNNGDIPVDDYITQIAKFTELLKTLGFDEEIVKTVKGIFQIDDYETKKNSAREILDAEGDKSAGTLSKEDLDIIDKNKTEWKKELEADGKVEMSWDDLIKKLEEAKAMAWEATVEFEKISEAIDGIQDAYSTLNDVVTEYNENGFLSLDNLQALLSLEPEYLACLQMENGQLSISHQALQAMVQARLAEAKATVVQSAMDQLHTLAARTEADAVTDSATAASNAVSGLGAYASALGTVSQDAIVAAGAVTAFNAAVAGAEANKFVDQSEIDAILSSMNTSLMMIDEVGSNLSTNFNAIVGGDGDDTKTGGSGKGDSALERIQNKYESKIANLENQQTYIENEIEKLEANEEGISKSYYEKQIALEKEKLDLYAKEGGMLDELKALYAKNPTQETAEAIWEIEHAIQESTLRMIEFRKSIIELYNTAFEKIGEKYDDKGQLIDDAKSYLEGYMDLFDIQGELAHPAMYDDLKAQEEADRQNNVYKLASQQELYDQLMNSANPFERGSDEAKQYEEERAAAAIKMQADMRQTKADILENDKALAQFNEDLKNLYIEGWDKVREAFDNKGSFVDNQLSYIESYIGRLETLNIDVPESAYDEMIAIQSARNVDNQNQLDWEYEELERLKKEVGEDDERYQAKLLEVAQLETETYEGQTKVLEWEQKILDSRFDKFEQLISRIDDSINELNNISDLMSDEDVAYEDGSWTAEGISRAGLAFQEMEMQKQKIEECNEQLAEQERLLDEGKISQDKYYDNTQAIKDAQWSAIQAYDAAEDAIIDLNEARIDMIEDGMNKEIDAYQELIDLKKEELDAERDLYNFRKDIQKQTKDIAALERRIASMSGSTDASTIAERTKLEAELREAREGLDDTYYNHAMDSQADALDDEMESFEKSKMDYLENLRESIKETDLVIEQTYQHVLSNADIVLTTLTTLATEKGFVISENLMNPWINASAQSIIFKDSAYNNVEYLINDSGVITLFGTNASSLLSNAFGAGSKASEQFKKDVELYVGQIKTFLTTESPKLQAHINAPWKNAAGEKGDLVSFSKKVSQLLQKAVTDAKSTQEGQYGTLEGILKSPWNSARNTVTNWYNHVHTKLNDAITQAKKAAAEIEKACKIEPPSHIGGGDSDYGGGNGDGNYDEGLGDQTPKVKPFATATLKTSLKTFTNKATGENRTEAQNRAKEAVLDRAYDYYKTKGYSDEQIYKFQTKTWPNNITYKFSQYAKGTLGTKKDEYAITDEPWLGDELTMYATKQGTLSYMRAGSTVVPADLTKELIAIGEIGLDGLTMPKFDSGINLMSNYVVKPELNLSFDALVKAEHITEETLPAVKKLVSQELDKFARQLNYSIKRVGGK